MKSLKLLSLVVFAVLFISNISFAASSGDTKIEKMYCQADEGGTQAGFNFYAKLNGTLTAMPFGNLRYDFLGYFRVSQQVLFI